jgi:hypothetical protein
MKNISTLKTRMAGLLLAITAAGSLFAGPGNVTITVKDSDGNPIENAVVSRYISGKSQIGLTDANGEWTGYVNATNTTTMYVDGPTSHPFGTRTWTLVDPATNPTLTVDLVKVTVTLKNCKGTAQNGTAQWYRSGWQTIGSTPATVEVLDERTYDFRVQFDNRTSATITRAAGASSVDFTTTYVDLRHDGQIYWYNGGGWKTFNGPKEVLGGTGKTADFKFGGTNSGFPTYTLNIQGCNISGGLLRLNDENGNAMANYSNDRLNARNRCGGSWNAWIPFSTNQHGRGLYLTSCSNNNWDGKVTLSMNGNSQENTLTSSTTYQLALVNANLKTCSGLLSDATGAKIEQSSGGWYNHGNTGVSGTVSFYTFPGTVKVRATYTFSKSVTEDATISAGVNDIDFVTTALTIDYPGNVRVQVGGWPAFSKPTMNLLPGDYGLQFHRGGSWSSTYTVSVSGCSMKKIFLRMIDENGGGVADATFQPANGGTWLSTLSGSTAANGELLTDAPATYTKIKGNAGQGGSQELSTSQLNTSSNTWVLEIVRTKLLDVNGDPMTDGNGVLTISAGGWQTIGNLNSSGYLDIARFPGTASHRITYNSTTETKSGISITAGAGIQEITFQTGAISTSCHTQISAGGWQTLFSGKQFMPGTYTIRYPSTSVTVVAGQTTAASGCAPGARPEGDDMAADMAINTNLISYPNPFINTTTMSFGLQTEQQVHLAVYDVNGRTMEVLVNGTMTAGQHQLEWNAAHVAPGVYYIRMRSEGGTVSQAIVKQ